jgi:Holliday junction resolvase
MINNTKNIYNEKVKSMAEKYESQGFRVLLKPKADELPFYLGNYQPEMIAIKDGSGLVIEVKTNLSRVSVDRLQALAEEVSKHQGWHFLLVTLEDIEAKSLPGTSEQLPSWQDLADRFHEAHRLIENDKIEQAFKAAFLLLWSTFEGALRKRAVDVSIPIERFPVIGLLKHMYSLGELSISQFDFAQFCFEAWNSLAHGYIENLTLPVVHNFDNLVRELLAEWKVKLDISQLSSENPAAFRACPTLEPLTDLDSWTQSLIGVIQLGEENPTENYVDYLEEKYG